jgi:hypothetical protein
MRFERSDDAGPLLRVLLRIGDTDGEVVGPLIADRSLAGVVIADVLDRIYDEFGDSVRQEPLGPVPGGRM